MNNKLNIIFWSGTGNTETMANSILKGCKDNPNAHIIEVDKATLDHVEEADVLFLGCPSMGDEVLEESEMEPFIEKISSHLKGKKVVLFGSYGWGDGQWMRDWESRIENSGAILVEESIISNYDPSPVEIYRLISLGEKYSNL